MSMPVVVPVGDRTLVFLFMLLILINGAIRVRFVREVNRRLPVQERWPYLHYWTIFHAERFDNEYRVMYPKRKSFRIIASLTSAALLIVAVEMIRRFVA